MAKKPTISFITTGYSSTTLLNNNFLALRDAFDNTLSLDGSTPNSLSSDLDINSNDITNAKSVTTDELILGGSKVVSLASTLTFIGGWVHGTSYYVNNIVTANGNAYICLIDHTGGFFPLDLAAEKWALFASKGDSGSGSGDLVSSNNLSDVASASTALANLGLSATAAEINYTTDVTSNIQAQIDGKQNSNDILTDLAGLTQATNKIPYFSSATAASVLDFKDEDNMASDSATAIASQQSVKAYIDSKTSRFKSSDQSITAAAEYSITHNLGDIPNFFHIEFECTTAEHGYSIGNIAIVSSAFSRSHYNFFIQDVTTTTAEVGIGSSGIIIRHKTDGTIAVITNGSWKWRLVCGL